MASDNKANYTRIGLTLVLGTLAVLGTLVYLGGADGDKEVLMAETYCDGAVSGLSVGSEVNFRGVKVGEVKEITFVGRAYDVADEQDTHKILIRLALSEAKIRTRRDLSAEDSLRRFVAEGLRATVSSSGITGLSHIELNYPKTDLPPATLSWRPDLVCIPPAPSILDSFSDSASRVMAQLNAMDFRSAWSNVTNFAASAARLADGANAIVASQRTALGAVMEEAEAALANLRTLTEELKENPSLLLRPRDPDALPETAR